MSDYLEPSFERDTNYIDDRITRQSEQWPVEPGRYRLVVSRACPWASRLTTVRRLLGLEDAISLGVCGPTHDSGSWTFDLDPGGVDPVLQIPRLKDAFENRMPGYPRGITVPALVEEPTRVVVTNDFAQMDIDLIEQWGDFHRAGAPDLYPEALKDEMGPVMERIYTGLNNGVYRCGFASEQSSYEEAYEQLFGTLDWVEQRLTDRRYLVGDHITLADVRLFMTLVRFDPVYHGHFKCNRNKISEMPAVWAYARDLFQTPGFGDTVDFAHLKEHYYAVHTDINPTGIVPKGPALAGWMSEHGREALGGSPFGDGGAPGAIAEHERVDPAHNPAIGPDGLLRLSTERTGTLSS